MRRYAFAHVARRGATSGPALARHQDGDKRPTTALPRAGIPAIVHYDETGQVTDDAGREWMAAQIARRLDQCRRVGSKTRGRKPAHETDILCSGPPPYAADDAWSQERIHEWARASVLWAVKRAGPGSRLVRAVLHQDEASPHLHITILAADERGRLGWNRIRHGFGDGTIRANTRTAYASKKLMRQLQSGYHADVGTAFGLERGEDVEETGRKREPIDRDAGLEARVEEERAAADARWSERLRVQAADAKKERGKVIDIANGWKARAEGLARDRGKLIEFAKELRSRVGGLVSAQNRAAGEAKRAIADRDSAVADRDRAVRERDSARLASSRSTGEVWDLRRSIQDLRGELAAANERVVAGEHRDDELRGPAAGGPEPPRRCRARRPRCQGRRSW